MPICSGEKCKSTARLDGKTVVITGANTGIGKETAKDLVGRGARVIMVCRDVAKGQQALVDIAQENPEKLKALSVRKLDLSSMASIREFADEILEAEPRIDILINNEGIMFGPKSTTEDGFETQFGVNHLANFLLTNLLLDRIKESAPARIVILSSNGHLNGKMHFDDLMLKKDYGAIKAYCQSKLASILFAKELARRLEGTGVTTYAVHPGVVDTDLQRQTAETLGSVANLATKNAPSPLMVLMTPTEGAQTTIYCAVAEELNDKTGLYYTECKETQPSSRAKNMDDAKRLWEISCKLVGIECTEVG